MSKKPKAAAAAATPAANPSDNPAANPPAPSAPDEQPKASKVKLVRMKRAREDGTVQFADVHPDEVKNYAAGGFITVD